MHSRSGRFWIGGLIVASFLSALGGLATFAGERRASRPPRRWICPQVWTLPTGPTGAAAPASPAQCGAPDHGQAIGSEAQGRAKIVAPPVPGVSAPQVPTQAAGEPEIVLLGYSVKGVPITLHLFGTQGAPVLIFGAIHGSEPNSGELARMLLDHLLAHPDAYSGRRVAIIPVANPDGLVRTRRQNERGIDLNRNFPAANWKEGARGATYGGEKAGSEPETQAVIKAVELLQPDRIISIHAITRGRECNNYDGPGAELAELMKSHNGYRVARSIGYPTPGSFGSWAGIDRQIPTITLELPVELPGDQCWETHREALLAVIRYQSVAP